MSLTLAIEDNTNGTATATISGSGGNSVDVRYWNVIGELGSLGVSSLAGTRTGDGTISLSLGKGYYWFVVTERIGLSPIAIGNFVYQNITTGTDPIAEQIAQAITARVSGILTVADVVRPNRKADVSPGGYQVWLEQGTATRNQEKSIVIGHPPATAYDQEFTLTGFINQSNSDTEPTDTLINAFKAEVLEGVCFPAAWESWGGLAVDTVIGETDSTNQQDGGPSQFQITLIVTYRTKDNDPYTQV